MNVFLSWSGDRSGALASALSPWLPKVIQAIRPWMSKDSVDPGARWNDELSRVLESTHVGVLCLTRENLSAPWLLFEAGALAKVIGKARTIPYLLDFEPRELTGPLAQFQAVSATREGTFRLIASLNGVLEGAALPEPSLAEQFSICWPNLEAAISTVARQPPEQPPPPLRETDEVLGEILQLVRSLSGRANTDTSDAIDDFFRASPEQIVGQNMVRQRSALGVSQGEIARRAQLAESRIDALENVRVPIDLDELEQIAKALGMDLQTLLNDPMPAKRRRGRREI